MRLHSLKYIFVFLIACFNYLGAQYTIPKKPAVLYPLYDEVKLLNESEKQSLNHKLIKFADSTSTEIEIIIISSTKGEDINFLATMFGEKWGIGKKDKDNGVVFLIAVNDRTMSIQQGRAVEQYLTASVAGQILDYIVTPNFKQGNYYQGINRGTSAIMEALQGKFKPDPVQHNEGEISISKAILIIFIIFIILSFFFKDNGDSGNYDDNNDLIISRRGTKSYSGGFFPFPGKFGGNAGGGGFGGFGGGGSFGGGGASGNW